MAQPWRRSQALSTALVAAASMPRAVDFGPSEDERQQTRTVTNMAEGGSSEDQQRLRSVRLMSPYPPRPFQVFRGAPVAEGKLIVTFPVLSFRNNSESLKHFDLIFKGKQHVVLRADCAFDPYSEEWITASVDLQISHTGAELLSFNDGPFLFMTRVSVSDRRRIRIPYRRSEKSASTAFCSDGNRIAWPGYTAFSVYNRSENIRRTVPSSDWALCGAYSPDRRYLALLSADNDLLRLRIIDSNTHSFIVGGFTFPDFSFRNRPCYIYFEDNPALLLWSKCGRYLGTSTYHRELIVFKVKRMLDARESRYCVIPKLSHHPDFETISHPQAYDFTSCRPEKDHDHEITILALGTVNNCIRLYEVLDDDLGEVSIIAQTCVQAFSEEFTINCLRFSNARDLLAVALSSGVIDLLDSVSLAPVRRLQRAEFKISYQPKTAPYFHGFSALSFACSDKFLAAGATDGLVRVWCTRRPIQPLAALCRTVIRSRCKMDDMSELSLQPQLLTYLTDTAF